MLSGTDVLTAQQKDINTLLQYFDAESSIPEEDLILLTEILDMRWTAGSKLAEKLIGLSIIDYEDEKLLSEIQDAQSFFELAENSNTSLFLKELIGTLDYKHSVFKDVGNISFDQYVLFGGDNRYRWKLNFSNPNYSFGLIAERDPNEGKIIDHLSYYLSKQGSNSELIIGDYQIVNGYGLWSWRSVSTRKSFESITSLARMGNGVSPYRSANESWYIRGINYSLETKYGGIALSGGYTKQDGLIDNDGSININSSGLHTGETAIEHENNITEALLIGQWNMQLTNSEIVASVAGVNWADVAENSSSDWSGSVAISHSINNSYFFGEFGKGYNSSIGLIAGLRLKFPSFLYLGSVRYYSKGYNSLRSNPFAEWVGEDRNEKGLYQGIKYKFGRHHILVFGDLFQTNEEENDQFFPINGQETGIRWEWRYGRNYQRLEWKSELKSIEDSGFFATDEQPKNLTNQTFKYSGVYKFDDNLSGKLQLTFSSESSQTVSRAYGIDANVWWEQQKFSVYFDMVTVFTDGGSAWIYFWDVNLPVEMTTRVYTKDTFSPAVKFIYTTNTGFEIGFRFRAQWPEFNWKGTPDLYGALMLEILL